MRDESRVLLRSWRVKERKDVRGHHSRERRGHGRNFVGMFLLHILKMVETRVCS